MITLTAGIALAVVFGVLIYSVVSRPLYGDPLTFIWVQNESNTSVLVEFVESDGYTQAFSAAPGEAGSTVGGVGRTDWHGVVRVLDQQCGLLGEQRLDLGEGAHGVVVVPDGSVSGQPDTNAPFTDAHQLPFQPTSCRTQ